MLLLQFKGCGRPAAFIRMPSRLPNGNGDSHSKYGIQILMHKLVIAFRIADIQCHDICCVMAPLPCCYNGTSHQTKL